MSNNGLHSEIARRAADIVGQDRQCVLDRANEGLGQAKTLKEELEAMSAWTKAWRRVKLSVDLRLRDNCAPQL